MRTLVANPNTFRRTYLIQALNPPRALFNGMINPFSFGGGGSGLSKEGMELFGQFFSFDYMGAAEYEFGAAAQALEALVEFRKHDMLVASTLEVNGPIAERQGKDRWCSRSKTKAKTTVYILGCRSHLARIEQVVDSLITGSKVKGEYNLDEPISLKRGITLWQTLYDPNYATDGYRRMIAGLELDNGWMVFTSLESFRQMCTLFDVKLPDLSNLVTHIPPKAILSTEDADKAIMAYLTLNGPAGYNDVVNKVYELTYKIGDVVAPEHFAYCEQITKRFSILLRRKLITRDRKTKIYTVLPPKEKS